MNLVCTIKISILILMRFADKSNKFKSLIMNKAMFFFWVHSCSDVLYLYSSTCLIYLGGATSCKDNTDISSPHKNVNGVIQTSWPCCYGFVNTMHGEYNGDKLVPNSIPNKVMGLFVIIKASLTTPVELSHTCSIIRPDSCWNSNLLYSIK